MWKPSPKAESPRPRWNPSTSPSAPIQRRPSSARPPSRRLAPRDPRDSRDKTRRSLSLTPSARRVRVVQSASASARPRAPQDEEPTSTSSPAPPSSSASPYASAASWFSFSSRIPFRLGSTIGQASTRALGSPRSPQTVTARPLSSLNQVTSPLVTTPSSPPSHETPIQSSGLSARYDPESDPYTMSTTSAASTVSMCGSTDSSRELLMLMNQNVDEYVDRMSREAKSCLYETLPRLFRDCSTLTTKMREDNDLSSSTTARASGLGHSGKADSKETEKPAQKRENDVSSPTVESTSQLHRISLKDSSPTLHDALNDTKLEGHFNQEARGEWRLKRDADSREPSDVDMSQADPLEAIQENPSQSIHRDASLNRSPKRMRQETEETTLRAKSTIMREAICFESERAQTAQDSLLKCEEAAGSLSVLSDATKGSCLRKRKRVDDEVEGYHGTVPDSQLGNHSLTKVHLLPSEASDSDTSHATAVVDVALAGHSITQTKEIQPSAIRTFSATTMWQAADPTARGAKISAWNGELCRLILNFLECSTVIKIHFELQENARNQAAGPASRLPVHRDSTMTLTAMSPPALESSLLPSAMAPSSSSHAETQSRQHRRIARIRATGDLNAIIRGGNDILDTIARYEATRSNLMENLADTAREDCRAALRSSLHTLDYRHFSRLQLCTLELEASVVGLFRTLRMTI
ncbi:unnamed protein product [Mortierella alpina]